MTKMTKTVAAAVITLFAASTVSIAVSAMASGPTSTFTSEPTAASEFQEPSLSTLNGDATLEDVESNGPPQGGKISTEDPDLEEGYVDPNEPILPAVTLAGAMDGKTFNGVINVNGADANVTVTKLIVCVKGAVLLADGNSRTVQECPYELTQLELVAGENHNVGVSFSTEEFIARWDTPGAELAGSTIDGMSKTLTFSVHPSYDDSQFGETGFKGNAINLTF